MTRRGLEINCDVEGAEIYVLGYFIEYEASWFQEFLREQRAERVARVQRLAERLTETPDAWKTWIEARVP